jgi:hypothetical protein
MPPTLPDACYEALDLRVFGCGQTRSRTSRGDFGPVPVRVKEDSLAFDEPELVGRALESQCEFVLFDTLETLEDFEFNVKVNARRFFPVDGDHIS